MSALRVAVVGAGPAGLVAAAAAARLGMDVWLLDPQPDVVGSGPAILHHCGLRVLGALGLLDEVLALAAPLEMLDVALLPDVPLVREPFERLETRLARPVVLPRAALLGAVRRAGVAAGVRLESGARCSGLWVEGELGHVQTAAGQDLVFDVVLACDGARSRLRDAGALDGQARPTGVSWILVEVPGEGGDGRLWERFGPAGTRVGGVGAAGRAEHLWCTAPAGEWPALRDGALAGWIASFAPFGEEVLGRLRRVSRWDEAAVWDEVEVELRRWHRSPVFALGDAAHAGAPFLGIELGASMVDACILVQLLARGQRARASLDEVGRAWEGVRRPAVTRQRAAARHLQSAGDITSPAGRALRDLMLPVATRLDVIEGDLMALCAGAYAVEEAYFEPLPPPGG